MKIVPGRRSRPARRQPRRRAQSWIFALSFLALSVGSIAGVALARDRAEAAADRRLDRAAERAGVALEARLDRLRVGLAGSSALVDDGSIDVAAFSAVAEELRATGGVGPLVLVGVADGGGYEILHVVPDADATGEEIAEDPGRISALETAQRTRSLVISDLVDLIATGTPGFGLVHPLVDPMSPDEPVVGFVVAVLPLEEVEATARRAIGSDAEYAMHVDGERVAGVEFGPNEDVVGVPVRMPGAGWTVTVGRDAGADLTVSWLVAAGGLAAVAAMAALATTTSRHQRRLSVANELLILSEARTRAVQEVAGRLARALTAGEIVDALVDHLPAAVGAQAACIAVAGDEGRLEVLGLDRPADGAGVPLPGADEPGSHVATVLATGKAAWLRSPLDWRGDEATEALAAGGQAMALLPLSGDDVSGVLAVAYPRVRIFADDEQDLLDTVGILASRALARGRRYDAEHRAAVAFQRSALPDDLPVVDGLSVAARYRPATRQATVGGDWYDVLVLDDRRVVLVVGDVVGHGMVAAAAMGRLRTAFQAIARLSADPGAMVAALSNQADSIPDSFCTTVVCAVVDLTSGEMTWSRAGHPPPLLLRSDGVELLEEPCLPPLGVAVRPEPAVHRRCLAPGDRLVLYTDGIVERREESIDDGFRRLGIAAQDLGDLDPEEFSDALVEAMVPDEQVDDLAILVVRYDGSSPAPVARTTTETQAPAIP